MWVGERDRVVDSHDVRPVRQSEKDGVRPVEDINVPDERLWQTPSSQD
jgi:hypothetical protein